MKPTLRLRCLSVHRCAGLCLGGTLCGDPPYSMSVGSGPTGDLMPRDSVGKTWLHLVNVKFQRIVPSSHDSDKKTDNVNENTAQAVFGFWICLSEGNKADHRDSHELKQRTELHTYVYPFPAIMSAIYRVLGSCQPNISWTTITAFPVSSGDLVIYALMCST